MGKNGKIYTTPGTYSVLLSATKSQNIAKTRQALKDSSYGVPEMVKEFEHFIGAVGNGVGKAYRDMNKYEKGVFWLFVFGIGGYALDTALNEGKATKTAAKYADKGVKFGEAKTGEARDFLQNVYKGLTTKAPATVIAADSVQKQISGAGIGAGGLIVGGNASEKPKFDYGEFVKNHKFNDTVVIGGDENFKTKLGAALNYINEISPEDYKNVTYWLEEIQPGTRSGANTFTRTFYIGNKTLNSITPILAGAIIHDAFHIEDDYTNKEVIEAMKKWYGEGIKTTPEFGRNYESRALYREGAFMVKEGTIGKGINSRITLDGWVAGVLKTEYWTVDRDW